MLAHEIEIIAKTPRILISPSIAENGKSFAYVGIDEKTGTQAIFISYLKNDGAFSKPNVVVTTRSTIEQLHTRFRHFQPNYAPFSAEEFRAKKGLDSPIVQNDIITFSATIKNFKRGIFYAIKRQNKWQVYPIAIQDQKMPIEPDAYYKDFNAPYISVKQKAIFLATSKNDLSYVFSYKIPAAPCESNEPVLLVKADKKIYDFKDISVAQGNFATLAKDETGKTYVCVFDQKTAKLVKNVPEEYWEQREGAITVPDGPSYYAGKIAFSTHAQGEDGKVTYAIYSNAGKSEFAKPVVLSGKMIDTMCIKFAKVWNPTLYIQNNKAYITFMGSLWENSRITGVYLASIANGKVDLAPIAVPGQRLPNGQIVLAATIGAVSIRHGIIPLALRLGNGDNVIAVVRLGI